MGELIVTAISIPDGYGDESENQKITFDHFSSTFDFF